MCADTGSPRRALGGERTQGTEKCETFRRRCARLRREQGEDLCALLVDEYLAVEFQQADLRVLDPLASAAHHSHRMQTPQGLELGTRP